MAWNLGSYTYMYQMSVHHQFPSIYVFTGISRICLLATEHGRTIAIFKAWIRMLLPLANTVTYIRWYIYVWNMYISLYRYMYQWYSTYSLITIFFPIYIYLDTCMAILWLSISWEWFYLSSQLTILNIWFRVCVGIPWTSVIVATMHMLYVNSIYWFASISCTMSGHSFWYWYYAAFVEDEYRVVWTSWFIYSAIDLIVEIHVWVIFSCFDINAWTSTILNLNVLICNWLIYSWWGTVISCWFNSK